MNKLGNLVLFSTILAFAHSATASQSRDDKNLNDISEKFIQIQVERNITIGRAIKVIVSHYPQEAASIVDTALDLYPAQYKEIIHASISARPTLAEEVVTLALSKGISDCASIVETAINADPSYIDFVVKAAANSTPEQLSEIVRIAVITEPDSADYIVQSLAREHPNRIVDILQSAIGAVPFVGEYVVEALLAIFPNDEEQVITTAIRESNEQKEYLKRIIKIAQNSGIETEKLKTYAINGGVTSDELAQVMENQ